MIRSILALFLAASLGGCEALQTANAPIDAPTAQKTVFAMKTSYEALLVAAVAYNRLPRCGTANAPALCSDIAVVFQLRKADAAASATLDAAESAVRNLGSSPTILNAAIESASKAVNAMKVITAVYKIGG